MPLRADTASETTTAHATATAPTVTISTVLPDPTTRPSTIAGTRLTAAPVDAALANAELAQADETDDSHNESRSHPGCSVVPAALAAGDFTRAVRQYALAISFMMSEIRRQPARKDQRDSTVLDL